MQEQRFLRTAVEHERIPPLEAGDGVTVPGFFSQQERDRVLRHGAFGRRADLETLRVVARPPQHAAHGPVVNDDVGLAQQPQAAHADESGIPGAGADEEDASDRRAHRDPWGAK